MQISKNKALFGMCEIGFFVRALVTGCRLYWPGRLISSQKSCAWA
jgi:hypothetical protein